MAAQIWNCNRCDSAYFESSRPGSFYCSDYCSNYCESMDPVPGLEKRIDVLEETIENLVNRIAALETKIQS